jgi:hypothetical protein
LGVKTTHQYQIVFSDTPGAIQNPAYALQDAMVKSTHKAVDDCDLILLLSDAFGEMLYDLRLFDRYSCLSMHAYPLKCKMLPSESFSFGFLLESWHRPFRRLSS